MRTFAQRFTSRPFLLTVFAVIYAVAGVYYNIPTEKLAAVIAGVAPFILGESYRDGQAEKAQGASRHAELGAKLLPGLIGLLPMSAAPKSAPSARPTPETAPAVDEAPDESASTRDDNALEELLKRGQQLRAQYNEINEAVQAIKSKGGGGS